MNAIEAYLRSADAQETREAIVRFFASDMRAMIVPFDTATYSAAMLAYDEAEGNPLKRGAIVALVAAILAKENTKWVFAEGDRLLAVRSKEYAESLQRKTALQRFNLSDEKGE
jgi:hypothetical protein